MGWKKRITLLIIFTGLLFIVSTLIGSDTSELPVDITLESFNILEDKDEFFHHVDDMRRLKKSVMSELGLLEQKRAHLKRTVNELTKNSKDSAMQLKESEDRIAQLKLDIKNIVITRDETLKEYTSISLPTKLTPHDDEPHFSPPKNECQLHTCFDYSRCSVLSGFPVYLYSLSTDNNLLLAWKSAISKSHYVTDNPNIACVYLAIHEGGTFNHHLLPYWRGDGRNHIIINIISNQFILTKSRAMLAQTEFYHAEPVDGFDIILPYSNPQPVVYGSLPLLLPVRRNNLVSFYGKAPTHTDATGTSLITALSALNSPELSVNIDVHCPAESSCLADQWCLCSNRKQINIERNSTFIVIPNCKGMPTEQLSYRIYIALLNGAIPIILGNMYRLPMNELIPWNDIAIFLPSPRVTELVYIARNIMEPDLMVYKKRGRAILENYLLSIPRIATGLLDLLRMRINIPPNAAPIPDSKLIYHDNNPMLMFETRVEPTELLGPLEDSFPSLAYQRNFTSWRDRTAGLQQMLSNQIYPQTPWDPILPTDAKYHGSPYGFRPINGGAGGSGQEFSEALGGNNPREQFTILILTYDRADLLQQQLAQFYGLPYLNKVLVVWNNPVNPSLTLKWPHIHVPIQVIKTETNSLNNRFLPYKEIETEAILSMDDDMYLRHDEIVFAFRVWRENRDRVVGFPGRYHAWNSRDQLWNYNSNHSCELSLVLTGAAFFHKYYMYQYSYFMPEAIRQKVDDFMNCEDIAMNFLVSHITGKPPVKTTSRWTFRCPTCGEAALWTDESHFMERHQCIEYFTQVYGYLPLLYTQMRADSVLFKTRVPQDKTKCFSLV